MDNLLPPIPKRKYRVHLTYVFTVYAEGKDEEEALENAHGAPISWDNSEFVDEYIEEED